MRNSIVAVKLCLFFKIYIVTNVHFLWNMDVKKVQEDALRVSSQYVYIHPNNC